MDKMSTGSNQVLAVVNGKPVTEADVRQANADQFKALDREYQNNLHQLIENSLDPGRPGPHARGRGRRPQDRPRTSSSPRSSPRR